MSFLDDVKEYFRRGYRAGRSCRNGLEASAGCDEREAELAKCRSVITELWVRDEQYGEALTAWEQQNGQLAAELAESRSVIDAVALELHRTRASCDRYQVNGKRALARIRELEALQGHNRELESILKYPGVKKALLKALHPDMHPSATASERRALNAMFNTVITVFERIGGEQ